MALIEKVEHHEVIDLAEFSEEKLLEIVIESGQYIYSDQDGIILAPQALKSKSRDSV